MNDPTIVQPLGPGGIAQRMAEIRARMDQKFGTAGAPSTAFSNALSGQLGGLAGHIGPGGSLTPNPVSPFGGGVGVESAAPPGLREMVQQAATSNGLDPDLLDALVQQESGYSATARSKAGALGLTQLMPDTAAGLGVTNPFDPAQNLNGGARYLKQQIDRFGDIGHALAAYNAGPGAVIRHGGIPPYAETRNYVRSILSRVQQVKAIPHG